MKIFVVVYSYRLLCIEPSSHSSSTFGGNHPNLTRMVEVPQFVFFVGSEYAMQFLKFYPKLFDTLLDNLKLFNKIKTAMLPIKTNKFSTGNHCRKPHFLNIKRGIYFQVKHNVAFINLTTTKPFARNFQQRLWKEALEVTTLHFKRRNN